jgi:hypothetical protein
VHHPQAFGSFAQFQLAPIRVVEVQFMQSRCNGRCLGELVYVFSGYLTRETLQKMTQRLSNIFKLSVKVGFAKFISLQSDENEKVERSIRSPLAPRGCVCQPLGNQPREDQTWTQTMNHEP